MAIDIAFKSQIKSRLLQTLRSSVPEARHTTAQVLAKVASIDVPRKQWTELIGHLLNNMTQRDSPAGLKQSTLETLGYVCEEISHPDLQQDEVNSVLTAVIQGMNLENSSEVRLAATRALCNALEFAQTNFENEMERTYIMKIICETALSKEVEVRQAAFECLASIASMYYSVLGTYMQALFELTSNAVKGDVEPVALQAIEFWSSICEKEIELQKYKTADRNCWDSLPDFVPPHSRFVEKSRILLIPILLETLLMQEENVSQDDNIRNISMAGKKCLELVAQTVGFVIVPLVIPFVVANRVKPDWHCREAAVFALGAIIEGSTIYQDLGVLLKYCELVRELIDDLLFLMNDENNQVKETTAWTLGRIFEFLHSPAGGFSVITSDNLPRVVDILVKSAKDAPNVAAKVCRVIYTLAEGYEEAGIHSSFFMPYIPTIVESLLFAASRADVDDSKLRSAAYESLNEVVRCSSSTETPQIVRELLSVILERLSQTLELQIVSSDGKEKQADLQASLCGVLQVIIEKVSSADDLETRSIMLTQADQIMFLFLNVFACRSSTVHEEAMLAIGALALATGSEFSKYLPELYKYLKRGLQNFKDYQACSVTVGVVGDIVRALKYKVVPYCDGMMQILLTNLSSEALNRSVKPPIFSVIGDIALSIEENFQKYVHSAVPMMQRAAEQCAQMDSNDDELLEYGSQLKCSIFEAYSGILRGTKKSKIMMPYAQLLYEFIGFVLKEKDRYHVPIGWDMLLRKALAAVMDDLADLLGTNTKTLFGDLTARVTYTGACLQSDGDNLK
ncbi:hypothetical protein ABKV19_021596 [Rosa sericea]